MVFKNNGPAGMLHEVFGSRAGFIMARTLSGHKFP